MNAKLEYDGNSIIIDDFCHSLEDEMNGNPYNCSFKIRVVSGSFSGYADLCEYDYKEWRKFIEQLKKLVWSETDHVVLQEICFGSTIHFDGDGLGHVQVSGLIYGGATSHSLQFEFRTDQTVYPAFIKQLQSL